MNSFYNFTKIVCFLAMLSAFFGCSTNKSNADKPVQKETTQTNMVFASYTDSLEYIVNTGNWEAKLEALNDLYWYYQNSNISKALHYAWQQKNIAKQNRHIEWLADAYDNIGDIYFYEYLIDSTEYYYKAAFDLWTALENPKRIGTSLVNMSNVMRLNMMPDSSLAILQKALSVFEEIKDELNLSQVFGNIAAIYNDIGNYEKHDEYAFRALEIQEQLGASSALGITLINLCISMITQCRLDEAIVYGDKAIHIFREVEYANLLSMALSRTAEALFEKNERTRASQYINEAILLADQMGSVQIKAEALKVRANFYMQKGSYVKAKEDAVEALAIIDTLNSCKMIQVYILDLLTTLSICTNEQEDAKNYLKKYIEVKNIIQQEKWTEQISEMETKYATEKQLLRISSLEKVKRLYSWLSITGGIVFLLTIIVFIFFWVWAMQRKRLAEHQKQLVEQQLKQIVQEKQLIAAQAALEGENTERSRLAKDLHDGLGSMLSLVKITLPNMENGMMIEAEDVTRLNNAIILLDKSINEMRRVAHHMMPESLVRYGIKASLSDFCCATSKVDFQYFGNEQRIDSKLEILLYRVAHELINNALKHAEAQQIKVQLVQEDDRVSLTVYDNGKGFDTSKTTTGMGLENIRNRIETYNGKITLFSSPGNGTEVNIEISINK